MKRTYKAKPGTEVNSVDQQGNVWPEPLVFDKSGALTVDEDQQDVIAALEGAVGAGVVARPKEPAAPEPNRKKE